jgi:hypothetical protein
MLNDWGRGHGLVAIVGALTVACSSSPGGVAPSVSGANSSSGSETPPSNRAADASSGEATSAQGAADAGPCTDDAGASMSGATLWTDGTSKTASVVIAAGSTVVIAPGATITMGANAPITVYGTLVASSACAAHAKVVWPAGAGSTTGITVASAGSVRLDGVDISGAAAALNVHGGAVAEYDHGTIDGSAAPFTVAAGGTLNSTGAAVTRALGESPISGSLTVSYLDYDSNGNAGIIAEDSSTLDIRNSKLHGIGPSADMIVSAGYTGGTIHVQNTEIYEVHCAFHFSPVSTFDISYTNMHDNAYGFMLFGSGAAGGTVKYSNIDSSNSVAFAPAGTNGPITYDHCYMPGASSSAPIVVTNPVSSPVPGAGPM